MHKHFTDTYREAFDAFLKSTDEKSVLLAALSKSIAGGGVTSVLDIGAGNGKLAIPLSKVPKRYVALEQRPDYVARLREAGIKTIEASFPTPLKERFDLVLSCHSMPSAASAYEPFVDAALACTTPDGALLLVTYEDNAGAWHELLRACDLDWPARDISRFNALTDFLAERGIVMQETVQSHVRTESLDTMMHALGFVYSDGDKEKLDRFINSSETRQYLAKHYRDGDLFAFPFDHILLTTSRH